MSQLVKNTNYIHIPSQRFDFPRLQDKLGRNCWPFTYGMYTVLSEGIATLWSHGVPSAGSPVRRFLRNNVNDSGSFR